MYLLYLLLMMWGFACAYCVLFRKDQEHEVRYSFGLYPASAAQFQASHTHSTNLPAAAPIPLLLFLLCAAIQ